MSSSAIDFDKVVTLDFETYYDQDYSLKAQKYNTSSYVRDEQFQIHCLGAKIGSEESFYMPPEDIQAFLDTINWSEYALLAHNTAFDGFILSERFGIHPAYYLDTMSMMRALHPETSRASLKDIAEFYGLGTKDLAALVNTKGKRVLDELTFMRLGNYCMRDVDLCHTIAQMHLEVFPRDELDLIDWAITAFCAPALMVNEELAREALTEEIEEKRRLIEAAGVPVEDLQSNEKFAAHLRACGVEPPEKWSSKQQALIYAFAQTDGEFLDLMEHEDIRVARLIQARLAVKSTLAETRAQRLLDAGANGARLPVLLNYYGAKTGRFSGGNKMNMQNLTRGSKLRRSIMAPPGYVIVAADSSQIEARWNAYLAGQDDLVEAFRRKQDIYSEFASEIFGRKVDRKLKVPHPETGELYEPDETEGFVGKVCILGLGYQMGGKKLQTTLGLGTMGKVVELELPACNRIVYAYRKRYAAIVKQWDTLEALLLRLSLGESSEYKGILGFDRGTRKQPFCVWLPNGLALQYPNLRINLVGEEDRPRGFMYDTQNGPRTLYGGKADENVIQALARITVTEQMLEARRRGHWIVSMSHDEILTLAPEREAEEHARDLVEIMSTPPRWAPGIPITAEAKFAWYYSK